MFCLAGRRVSVYHVRDHRGDVALNYYLHRDGRDSAAEQQRMEDIGAELAPALQDLD